MTFFIFTTMMKFYLLLFWCFFFRFFFFILRLCSNRKHNPKNYPPPLLFFELLGKSLAMRCEPHWYQTIWSLNNICMYILSTHFDKTNMNICMRTLFCDTYSWTLVKLRCLYLVSKAADYQLKNFIFNICIVRWNKTYGNEHTF